MEDSARAGIAFSRPGGENCPTSRTRPVDLVHLSRQTLGDRAVEQEVLGMFVNQLSGYRERIAHAGADERASIFHTLKGSARGLGAFHLAECAERMEARPEDRELEAELRRRIDDVREFVAAICR